MNCILKYAIIITSQAPIRPLNNMHTSNGSVFWNLLYPGHIHLPPNTAYPARVGTFNCLVVIVDHHEPVVVTDFNNDLVVKKTKSGAFSQLKKPIPYRSKNTIAVDFKAVGNPAEQHVFWTKDHLYQIYRKQSFTEITVAIECHFDGSPESNDLGIFQAALDRFIQVYRIAANDPKASSFGQLEINSPVVRRCFVTYSHFNPLQRPRDRMLAALPKRFPQLIQFRILEFAEDAVRLNVNPNDLAIRVGHHFEAGTKVSDSQNALLNCFALLKKSKNYRYAVIDAFSVAEVVAFDLISEASKHDPKVQGRFDHIQAKKGRVTIYDAINSFLPYILRDMLDQFPGLIGKLDQCRKIRHSAMHERASSNVTEAELVLNASQQLIFAAEAWRSHTYPT